MSVEATTWLIDQRVQLMRINAVTFDPPVWAMVERKQFWASHRLMVDHDDWHLEKLTNLDKIRGPFGFNGSCFPVKWVGMTAAPVRTVAAVED